MHEGIEQTVMVPPPDVCEQAQVATVSTANVPRSPKSSILTTRTSFSQGRST